MSIKIKTEKVVTSGLKGRIITEISLLTKKKLPFDYVNGPHIYLQNGMPGEKRMVFDVYHSLYPNKDFLIEGEFIVEETFQARLKTIEECGERLGVINKEIKVLEKEWFGSESFAI